MKERPILFSAPMVRALLAGTKTQTRRVAKVPADANNVRYWAPPGGRSRAGWADPGLNYWTPDPDGATASNHIDPCPYGQPGDRLWVREAHSIGPGPGIPLEPGETAGALRWPHVTYLADGAVERRDTRWKGVFGMGRPSIHMPRWASRILLEVVAVRVERLQDISEADAIAEGCSKNHNGYFLGGPHAVSGRKQMATAQQAYRDLWESINGPGSWDANPWVWVVEFKRVEG